MIPIDAFQAGVRVALLADPVIAQHIAPAHVRVGTMRPEQLPAIVIAPTRVAILGRAAGGQIVAEVSMLVHAWASTEGETNLAQDIGAAVFMALMDAPRMHGLEVDEWERPYLVWSDQSAAIGNAAHGAISLKAIIRWHD